MLEISSQDSKLLCDVYNKYLFIEIGYDIEYA